jgi:hypothetical protein
VIKRGKQGTAETNTPELIRKYLKDAESAAVQELLHTLEIRIKAHVREWQQTCELTKRDSGRLRGIAEED